MTDWLSYLRAHLPTLATDPARESEIVEELAQHLADLEQEKLASGATPEVARAAALAEVADRRQFAREILRAERPHSAPAPPPIDSSVRFFVGLEQEVRHSIRQLARIPAFAATVIVLLALGIGINAATYSVVRNVLLEPLPFPMPESLTIVWSADKGWTTAFQGSAPVSGPIYLDWRRESRSFEHLVATMPMGVNLTGHGEAVRLQGTFTTSGLFEMLHARPSLGRTFRPDEEQPGHSKVAVISDAFWQNRLGADPHIIGRSLTLNGEAHTVVGVMPRGFQHPSPWTVGTPTEVWIPLPLDVLQVGRDRFRYAVLGRLKSDVSHAAAQAEMTAISGRLERAYPETDNSRVALLIPLQNVLVGRLSRRLWMLLGASGLVFLVVCANVAGLFAARAGRRQTEMAIRAGLGATRGRLVRQFAIEHLPMCLLGGMASVAVAAAATRVLRALMPPTIPRIEEIRVDGPILGMALLLSLVMVLIAGIAPTWTASGCAYAEALRQGRGPAASVRGSGRRLLVVAQLALTLMLAHGAALMLRSYWTLRTMDTGFSTGDVLTMRLDVSGPRYPRPQQVGMFFDEAVRRIESLPGVTQAAAINRLPLEGGRNDTVTVEGQDPQLGRGPLVETRVITPGYFDAMGIRLISGRMLTELDGSRDSFPTVVVNQAMARLVWPDASPIGRRLRYDEGQPWLTVVGVVTDTRQFGMERPPRPEAYMIHGASPFQYELRYLIIRTATEPANLVGAVRREIDSVDSNQPITDIRTMAEVVESSVAERRFGTLLVGLFAFTALALVVAAIYALMSFFVGQRTPEIGVRMAFGATRTSVLRMILWSAGILTVAGTAIGLGGVVTTARLARALVYGISPSDPGTVAGCAAVLVVIALAGALVPAWRASRIDPVEALRAE